MNTIYDYQKFFEKFTYKPNWFFHLYESQGDWWLRVTILTEDSRAPFRPWEPMKRDESKIYYYDMLDAPIFKAVGYSPSRPLIEVTGNYAIPYFTLPNEEKLLGWMKFVVLDMEKHEMDEWFRYNGELVDDPHAKV